MDSQVQLLGPSGLVDNCLSVIFFELIFPFLLESQLFVRLRVVLALTPRGLPRSLIGVPSEQVIQLV